MSKQIPLVSIRMDAETPDPTEMKTGVEIVDATQAAPSPGPESPASETSETPRMKASIVFGPPGSGAAASEDVALSMSSDQQPVNMEAESQSCCCSYVFVVVSIVFFAGQIFAGWTQLQEKDLCAKMTGKPVLVTLSDTQAAKWRHLERNCRKDVVSSSGESSEAAGISLLCRMMNSDGCGKDDENCFWKLNQKQEVYKFYADESQKSPADWRSRLLGFNDVEFSMFFRNSDPLPDCCCSQISDLKVYSTTAEKPGQHWCNLVSGECWCVRPGRNWTSGSEKPANGTEIYNRELKKRLQSCSSGDGDKCLLEEEEILTNLKVHDLKYSSYIKVPEGDLGLSWEEDAFEGNRTGHEVTNKQLIAELSVQKARHTFKPNKWEELKVQNITFDSYVKLASALEWKNIGSAKPTEGIESRNSDLSTALQASSNLTRKEWEGTGEELSLDLFVKAGDSYFQPVTKYWKPAWNYLNPIDVDQPNPDRICTWANQSEPNTTNVTNLDRTTNHSTAVTAQTLRPAWKRLNATDAENISSMMTPKNCLMTLQETQSYPVKGFGRFKGKLHDHNLGWIDFFLACASFLGILISIWERSESTSKRSPWCVGWVEDFYDSITVARVVSCFIGLIHLGLQAWIQAFLICSEVQDYVKLALSLYGPMTTSIDLLRHNSLGLKWKRVEISTSGTEIKNESLAAALQSKMRFTHQEWRSFQESNIRVDSVIKVDDQYFTPDPTDVVFTFRSFQCRGWLFGLCFGIFTGGFVMCLGLYLHLVFKDAKSFTLTQNFYITEKSVDMTYNAAGIILISVSSVFLVLVLWCIRKVYIQQNTCRHRTAHG